MMNLLIHLSNTVSVFAISPLGAVPRVGDELDMKEGLYRVTKVSWGIKLPHDSSVQELDDFVVIWTDGLPT